MKNKLVTDYQEGEGWFISDALRCSDLPDSYFIAATLLIDEGLDNDSEHFIIAPALYLCRHAIELYLKKALENLSVTCKGHDILTLYYELASSLEKASLEVLPYNIFEAIMAFHAISPRSTELRYTTNNEEYDLLGSKHSLFINLKNAKAYMNEIQEYFKSIKS